MADSWPSYPNAVDGPVRDLRGRAVTTTRELVENRIAVEAAESAAAG